MNHLRVLFFSKWFANPYKTLLTESLNEKDVYVEEKKVHPFFLFTALRSHNVDILHFHELPIPLAWKNPIAQTFKFLLFSIQIFILKSLRIKIVWTVHEWDNKNSSRKIYFNPFYAKLFRNCFDAFITHCETGKKNLVKELGFESNQKVSVIYHGNYINCYKNEVSSAEARETLNISNDDAVFLLFGGIYRYKGILEAIEAFKQTDDKQASLLIVGKSTSMELEKDIKEQIKKHNNIRFIPKRVEDDEVQLYMNASDCVLVPYKVFTTSGVAVLAMSFGRVCIAPRIGFFSDVLDDSGCFFYDSDDVNGLRGAIKQALEDKAKLISMGQHNFELAKQWDWRYVAEKTLNVYHP